MDSRLMICATLALLALRARRRPPPPPATKGSSTITNERSSKKVTEADLRNRARARTDLAGGYYRNGQLAVALDEARRAVAIDPSYAEAYGLLGLIYMDMKEQRDAEESFQRALKLDAGKLRAEQQLRLFSVQHRARAGVDRILQQGDSRSALPHACEREPERRRSA